MDISLINIDSEKKLHDLCLVYFAHMYSNPKSDDHFKSADANGAIEFYPIVPKRNGVFSSVAKFKWLVFANF